MSFSPAALHAFLERHSSPAAWRVAFSGGCDSAVLLHALAALRERLAAPVSAIHVDHQLQPQSAEWSRRCEAFCAGLGIPCAVVRVDAQPRKGESREAAARRARYGALSGLIGPGEALLTAHHQDDQAETLLLQLMRGTGPRGLAAMPEAAPFGEGMLLRPLLGHSRAELCAYAEREAVAWIDDPSNFDVTFDRNFLRHEVLPLLARRWPAATATMARGARLQAESAQLLDDLAALDSADGWDAVHRTFALEPLRRLSPARRRNVLRHALRESGLPLPGSVVLERVLAEVIDARDDAEPFVAWPGGEVRRFRDRLWLMPPLLPAPEGVVLPWDLEAPLLLPGGLGHLRGESAVGQGMRVTGPVEVRFRTGGERCRPAGRAHHQTLKHLLQEAGVPPWERERLPLIYVGGELAAVGDLWTCHPFAAAPGERGMVIRRERGG
jgi:tRNA(Ile)-lysidine synthase